MAKIKQTATAKKAIGILLTLILILSSFPIVSMAETDDGDSSEAAEYTLTLNDSDMTAVLSEGVTAGTLSEDGISVLSSDGQELSEDDYAGTGCTVQITDSGTSAEYTVIVSYDVDGSGKVTASDARLALRAAALLDALEGVYLTAADFNSDGNLTAADARNILRYAAKLSTDDSSGTSSDSTSTSLSDAEYIEETLNLANNEDQEWTYSSSADAWILSIVSAVAYPEIPDEQGVSVCVPGAYVTGIDTDGDGEADITADTYTSAVKGSLVIDYTAQVVSTNGQIYTAATAPVILNTGAAGYSSSTNTTAATTYASEGYINVACGNRGKQDTATDDDGNTYYTGDAPSCLVDQKNAARFVKYNILLGNLPGSVDYFVSTGGSGGGAHATMFAATSNNSDFYDYEIEAGAVGVYKLSDGSYSTTVTIDGTDYEISDGAWGCIAYSAITSLYEADMALAFEYYMDTTYDFGSSFQEQLAAYLSEAYMEYINEQNLTVDEADVSFDLNGDGDMEDTIELTIEYDLEAYPETNGYYGTYLDLYLAEFQSNLQWYLDNLDYAQGWTWFDEDGNALSDEEVANMTSEDKAAAFIEGRYAKGSSTSSAGTLPSGMNGAADFTNSDNVDIGTVTPGDMSGEMPGDMSDMSGEMPGNTADMSGEMPDSVSDSTGSSTVIANTDVLENSSGDTMDVGTPDAGTTQAAGSSVDSANYSSYEEMVAAYEADIAEILAGDEYGNNIVDLYNPLNYIGDDDTENPTWVRILMGASEGDMSMFSSLNLQIAMLNAGIDANIEWQWDGGHVPSEILSESFSLYVDQMYGEYAGGLTIETPEAEKQTENGTADSPTGTDLSSWVDYSDITNVSFTLASAVAYRTNGASKAMPGFDVIDYGQEDYVFGSSAQDARHWDVYLLEIFQKYKDVLEPLFNAG
ncbi:MAG: dockerin type I domain-containing protein [Clostridiales bacterium]|nr:dockerin type I domain-containing protein [Clostridiales bacterium]